MFTSNIITFADFGPKPSLHIYIQGNGEKQFYVNIMDKDYNIEGYDSSKMFIYKEGEWKVALYKNPSEIKQLENNFTYTQNLKHYSYRFYNSFHGIGLAETFKIVIQYETGKIVVSNPITNHQFTKNILYDIDRNQAKTITLFDYAYYQVHYETIISLGICILVTILVELLLALPFKIRPLKIVILTNILTQIILFIILYSTYRYVFIFLPLFFIILELIIWYSEFRIYKKYINPISKARLVLYVISANFASAILGIISTLYGRFKVYRPW